MSNYYLVGAFDRHNYGDILFPVVHKAFIEKNDKNANIYYISITQSDMEHCGGFKTLALKDILKQSLTKEDTVILCGGDILSADWLLMLGHVSSRFFMMPFRIARRLLGINVTNSLARIISGEVNQYPYIVSHKDTKASIFYTSVGGAGFTANDSSRLKQTALLLSDAEAVSVRDVKIQKLLENEGLRVKCTPDTALIMSDFYTPEMLSQTDWKATVKTYHDFSFEKYYSFQGAKRLIDSKIDVLVEEITTVYERTGFSPMMVPIGRAPDHEDHIPLQKLADLLHLKGIPCALQESEHLVSIMASLAFATTYVGTSLHGAITTYSFGSIPCALMSNDVKKLKDFLQTWLDDEDFRLFEQPVFAEKIIPILEQGGKISNQAKLIENKELVNGVLAEYVK